MSDYLPFAQKLLSFHDFAHDGICSSGKDHSHSLEQVFISKLMVANLHREYLIKIRRLRDHMSQKQFLPLAEEQVLQVS